jgi:uncharacterized protein YndB with AHSA1/START domain
MFDTINKISSQAVNKATGKTWEDWIGLLDKLGAKDKTHNEIVNILRTGNYISNEWWLQTVTVGYEYARGSRILGETASAGFEIGVQKAIPIPAGEAWQLITSPKVLKIWLGNISNLNLVKGYRYQTSEGTSGEIRSVKPGEKIRLTWQPHEWKGASTLQISLVPNGNKTSIRIHHEKLVDHDARINMQMHWKEVFERISQLIETKEIL